MITSDPIQMRIKSNGSEAYSLLIESYRNRTPICIGERKFIAINAFGRFDGEKTTDCGAEIQEIKEVSMPAWVGIGSPPAGTICELKTHAMPRFNEAEIRYMSSTICVWKWHGDLISPEQVEYACNPELLEFRPIRTAEQISAEARSEWVREFCKATNATLGVGFTAYDQGYRKQKDAQ